MAKKRKIPKTLAGVKVPKPLRRSLRDLARSQNGRAVLVELLAAAGTALAATQAAPGSKARRIAAAQGPKVKAVAKAAAAAAFAEAVRSFTEVLRSRRTTEPAADPAPATATTAASVVPGASPVTH
jgi:hypothetical protein